MSSYSLRDQEQPDVELTKDLQIVYLELPKFGKTVKEIESRLDVWIYMFKNSEKIKLSVILKITGLSEAQLKEKGII